MVFRTIGILFLFSSSLFAQDTLRITLAHADSLLVARNLALIVAHYEIDKAVAAKIQARLFNNPEMSTEWSLYNPAQPQWFDVGSNGQRIVALEKVFQIAGQRRAAIKLAEEEARMSELQYDQLVRSLRFELHVTFSRYHFLKSAVENIDSQLKLLKNLISIYSEHYKKGNVSLQNLTRLNTTYFTINDQVKDAQQELINLQQTLKILLSEERTVLPDNPGPVFHPPSALTVEELVSRALVARPEVKLAGTQQRQGDLRYALARKEGVPDLTAGVVYDHAGSYVNKYTAFTVGMKIPIFHRNQGQIQAARIAIQQNQKAQLAVEQRIVNEVQTAWQTFTLLWNQYSEVGQEFEGQLNELSEGLVTNYGKSNISLLEFTDLFEAYNTNIILYNQLKADVNLSYEELNYAVGEDIHN